MYYFNWFFINIYDRYVIVHKIYIIITLTLHSWQRHDISMNVSKVVHLGTYMCVVFPSRSHLVGWLARNSKAHREIYRLFCIKIYICLPNGLFFVACHITSTGYYPDLSFCILKRNNVSTNLVLLKYLYWMCY